MGRELPPKAAVLPVVGLIIRFVQGSRLGSGLEPVSRAGLESLALTLVWDEGEITTPTILSSRCGGAHV